jgi:hypothetical protein
MTVKEFPGGALGAKAKRGKNLGPAEGAGIRI